MSRRLALSLRRLLHVHNTGDCGSPRVSGSTSERRSSSRLASVSLSGLRPPPRPRTRGPAGGSAPRQPAHPRPRKPPPPPLIKHRSERLEPPPNRQFINHTNPI